MLDRATIFTQYEDTANNGFYTHHLADVSHKGNSAYTTSDVFNKNGALLIRKGVTIDINVRDKLLRHKLVKPLDHQVGLERQINGQIMLQKYHQLLKKYPDVAEMSEALHFNHDFENQLRYFDSVHPVISQKLTVLDCQLNHEFENGLFNAWLSTLIAKELGFTTENVNNVFIASLLHDIGMMHLDPDIVCSHRQLSPAEWKTMQAHVIVGKIIADAIPYLSPEVSRAVVEHHETCHASGYPFSACGFERSMLGRIIAMSDSVHAIRVNNFEKEQRTLGDIKPYLQQLNSTTQGDDVSRAMISIIKKAKLNRTRLCPAPSSSSYARNLQQQVSIMARAKQIFDTTYSNLKDLCSNSNNNNKHQTLTTLKSIMYKMIATTNESGLLSTELVNWLAETGDSEDMDDTVLEELNEVELLMKELTWQMRNTMRMLSVYHDSISQKTPALAAAIMASIESIQASLEQLNEQQIMA